ncbi:MAG: MBL fold metallo-hydrolase [Salinisphaera sp.]|jgi:L-ascorbate metabolism protein UlaG (beta-lactamase superfamily)|nr:MBL fold metallo-hydrolase [Salinisphaera sp.]
MQQHRLEIERRALAIRAVIRRKYYPDLPDAPNDHFDGKRFFNPESSPRRRGDLLRWLRNRQNVPWQTVTDFQQPAPPAERSQCPVVTWINHATVLIQIADWNVLTDPVFSNRVSPSSTIGPRRHHPPGVDFDHLPPIDVVLISHAHYDHLDRTSIRRLISRHDPLIVAGLGLARWLKKCGSQRVVTIDWWQNVAADLPGLAISGVPARHWSKRSLFDRNRSLWLGYWLHSAKYGPIYFAGDTGYGAHFRQIRDRLGKPALALLPIGAYEPRWFMAPQHMNPDDAVRAHLDLGAHRSIGIHFATFKLTDEGRLDPVTALAQARERHALAEDAFQAPAFGQSFSMD